MTGVSISDILSHENLQEICFLNRLHLISLLVMSVDEEAKLAKKLNVTCSKS